ncbi:MAG: glycosyltransferase [Proteobacteria bacterium]|jgi:glycosyltransferase involved in cell wall biosynthesis|nr:glycosyltransferase [Alphaproteobacteria bacterium]NCC03848.1 glycosyltransferase [Pseudomonadota bacterium]
MTSATSSHSNRNHAAHKPAAAARTTVLHLTASLELSHEAREVVDMCILTHRAGWRPLIVSNGGSLVLEAERAAVRHTRVPLTSKNFLTRWRNRMRLDKLIQRERPVVVHTHGYNAIDIISKQSVKHHLPLLIDLTEPCPITHSIKKSLQLAANRGAHFRVPSKYMVKFLKEDLGLKTQYLYHVPPGIDLVWYEAVRVTPERINSLYKLWRLPEQSTVVIMATPFATGYGHHNLLEAMTKLTKDDIYVVLIGDDKRSPGTRAQIEKQVVTLGLEGKVIMPENCTDWPAACWLSSLVVAINTMPRGQAPELLAAQAIGRPVIVSNCGANAEMVLSGETAWVVPPDNEEALLAALKESLAMGASRRIDLAVRTRTFTGKTFPQEAWRDSIFELYDGMLRQPALSPHSADA